MVENVVTCFLGTQCISATAWTALAHSDIKCCFRIILSHFNVSNRVKLHRHTHTYAHDTIRYDTIEEFNVDSKAEYTA